MKYGYIIYSKDNVIFTFESAKTSANKNICDYPLLRELDLLRYAYFKPTKERSLKENVEDALELIKKSTDINIPRWMLEYKEIQDLVKDITFRKVFFSKVKLDLNSVVQPSRRVKVQGRLNYFTIFVDKFSLTEKTISVKCVFTTYKQIRRSFLLNTQCKSDVYIPDLNREVLLKIDKGKITRFKNTCKLGKLTYDNISFTLTLKQFKQLFKDRELDTVFKTLNGTYITFVEIQDILKDPDNKPLMQKIVSAYNSNEFYVEFHNDIIIFDPVDVKKFEKEIALFLSDADIKAIKEILQRAQQVKKESDPKVIDKLKRLGFKAVLSPYQEVGTSWMYNLYKNKIPGAILGDEMGLGKGLLETTKILTPTGWVELKNLSVGDAVVDESGNTCFITGVYDQGEQDLYKITFEDKREIITDKEHLWEVSYVDNGELKKQVLNTQTLHLTQHQYEYEIPLFQPTTESLIYPNLEYNIETLELSEETAEALLLSTSHKLKFLQDVFDRYGLIFQKRLALQLPKGINDNIRTLLIQCLYSVGAKVFQCDHEEYDIFNIEIYDGSFLFNLRRCNSLTYPHVTGLKILNIEKLNQTGKTICIAVDSPRKLYVAENYIVTHNTVQALGFLAAAQPKSVAVIAPASVTSVWKKEIEKFYPPLLKIVDIYSYESIARKGLPKEYDIIILDEGQKVKNPATLAATLLRNTKAKFKLILTGTPIENSVKDLFSLVMIIMPQSRRLLQIIFNKMAEGDQLKAVKLTKSLITGIYLGRKKTKDIVPVKFSIINETIPLSEQEYAIYKNIKKIYSERLKRIDSNTLYYNEAIVGLQRLLMCVSNPEQLPADLIPEGINVKSIVPSKLKKLKNLVSDNRSKKEKTIVFAIFSKTIERLFKELGGSSKVLVIQGSTPRSERGAIVTKFQTDPKYDVIVLSLQAGATGLTLTAANHVVMYDLWWNPAIEAQAFARAYRRGQTKDTFAYRLIAKDTLDEKIVKTLGYKSLLLNTFKETNSKEIAKKLIAEEFE